MSSDTQALLDELASPKVINIGDAQSQMLDCLDVFMKMDRQASEFESLLRRAELTEKNPAVRGKFEEGKQVFAAIMRVNREISQRVNEVVNVLSSQIPTWLNGIEEEREVLDPAATEEVKRVVIEALDELDGVEGDTTMTRAALQAVEPQLARGIRVKKKVRTPSFRSVSQEAGYETGA